jgi:hypothetical protein
MGQAISNKVVSDPRFADFQECAYSNRSYTACDAYAGDTNYVAFTNPTLIDWSIPSILTKGVPEKVTSMADGSQVGFESICEPYREEVEGNLVEDACTTYLNLTVEPVLFN